MIEVEHMGLSPSQEKKKKGNHFGPEEESTSEQARESGSEYLLTELSESKSQCGYTAPQNEPAENATGVSTSGIHKQSPEYVAKNSSPGHSGLLSKDVKGHNHTDISICAQETVSGKIHECGSEHEYGAEIDQNELEEACTLDCDLPAKYLQPCSEGLSKNAITESLGKLPEDSSKYTETDKLSCPQLASSEPAVDFNSGNVGLSNAIKSSKSSLVEPLELPKEFAKGNSSTQQSRVLSEDMAQSSGVKQHETKRKSLLKHSARRRDGKTTKAMKKKYMLRSLISSDRVLRSKSQEQAKATELSNSLPVVGSSEQQKRRKRKRGKVNREVADEYSRIRSHLRYLLNRINYEQSLIAAYSAEGWKGLSLEKLKPEKELQRATSEILRRKLKIRDLFQRIDSLCAEGRLPESLFDSEGQIDSEDIFCSKCGLKDLSANNDIILCDGACDRGFHQYCLQPPLLKEDIPPDDEGWLCPGCDCKVDCIELVNESQGTSVSITDSWEKVFPEAAVAAAGQNQDPNFGLPSDDSDDNDYNPDGSETDEKDQGDESSSDESDFTSTSEELEVPANVDQNLGLPSDDSEDDDYDPDGPNHDEMNKPESSGSDFTSDSEDLCAILEDAITSQKDESPMSSIAPRDSKSQNHKIGGEESLNDELLSIMEPASGQDGSAVYVKRSIERLDYKKLYDETYGNVPSSSSDDGDWSDTTAPRKRKKCTAEVASAPANGNVSVRTVSVSDGRNQTLEETEDRPRRKTRQASKSKDTELSPAELQGGISVSASSGKRAGSSTYKRLGEDVKQRLHKSFKENHYPDRTTKESLAKELDITFQQVSKWFENARWSFNNSPSTKETVANNASEKKEVTNVRDSDKTGKKKSKKIGS